MTHEQRDRARLMRFLQRQPGPSRLTSVADDLGLSMPELRRHLAQLQGIYWVETTEYVALTATGRRALDWDGDFLFEITSDNGSEHTQQPTEETTMQYRQGDVLLTPVSTAPPGTPVPPVNGRHVLAYGEATGHHHSIPASAGTLTLDEGGVTYLSIDELTGLTHQEHATIPLEPGVYRVTRQREWTDAQEPRPVVD